jgi:hypothetical protein|tara:strand:- start:1 stop:441 length:441 start_codon:yes stop_codon:yes gene_type:complete
MFAALKLGPYVALALLGAYTMLLRANIEVLETREAIHIGNTQRLESAIQTQNKRIEGYVAEVAANQIAIRYEADRANKANADRDREVSRLNSWRETLKNEIQDRPKVVARAAGLGTRRMLAAIEDATTPDSGSADGGDSSSTLSSP